MSTLTRDRLRVLTSLSLVRLDRRASMAVADRGLTATGIQGGIFSMTAESWSILVAIAAVVVVAIACSVVVRASNQRGRTMRERSLEGRLAAVDRQTAALEGRLDRLEATARSSTAASEPGTATSGRPRLSGTALVPTSRWQRHDPAPNPGDAEAPTLIAVPNLAVAAHDRDAASAELKERYAPIWSLAAAGSSAETIASATGQPIGQIELILGLRRQIDGNRTTEPHASHI